MTTKPPPWDKKPSWIDEPHGDDPPMPDLCGPDFGPPLPDHKEHLKEEMTQAFANPPHPSDWFTLRLFRLIAHADTQNRNRLKLGFLEEVEVYEEFING